MYISAVSPDLLIGPEGTVGEALQKLESNKKKILLMIDQNGVLEGVISDGDIRRGIVSSGLALDALASAVVNRKPVLVREGDEPQHRREMFQPGVSGIPRINHLGRVTGIYFEGRDGFNIGETFVGKTAPAFVIAEIGNNHNGDVALAKHLIDLALDSGADCAKFQMRDMQSLYVTGDKVTSSDDLGAQYTMDLLAKYQLSPDQMLELFDYCEEVGLPALCTPWDLRSVDVLEEYGMTAYKVASADLTNTPLLTRLAKTGRPLICSTGMSSESEIVAAARYLGDLAVNFVLLHCNSTYPTPFKDVNLSYLARLSEIGDGLVGYSGHERGYSVPVAAVALGAKVIEKHFTIDKNMEGNDHAVSLLPKEFKSMVSQIRQVEEAMGSGGERIITQGEKLNRDTLAKSIICSQRLAKGEVITREKLSITSPGKGLQPNMMSDLVGRSAKRDFLPGDYFYPSDLKDEVIEPRHYSFNRPFGIPVRYHDYASLVDVSNFDFLEFHLSYGDMHLDISHYINKPRDIGFAVHAPELFEGDHILDLASRDAMYRERSIRELQRVCDHARLLKPLFPKTLAPVIVVNAGGFSEDKFISGDEKASLYDLVGDALSQIDTSGVELIIQTMPPFPWHFGGQRFHNLFVDSGEIAAFCREHSIRICMDISHSMMACNYYGWDLLQFVETVSPYIAHMHIVDAEGVDGEGVQIGEGDVDFNGLAKVLEANCPGVQFIPEIWQGHKNQGEGFWVGLEFLERYL